MSDYEWDVFVSHNKQEKPWVREVVRQWQDLGLKVFFDEQDIEPGENILDGVERGLLKSRHTVLIVSPASMISNWVAREMSVVIHEDTTAKDRRLIPVKLEPVDRSEIRPALRLLNWIDLVDLQTRKKNYHHLLEALGVQPPWPDPPAWTTVVADEIKDDTLRMVKQEIGRGVEQLLQEIKTSARTTEMRMERLAEGIVTLEGHTYRSLRYSTETGEIYYGKVNAGNRNVLFNNQTILKIFNTICEVEAGEESLVREGKSFLYALGYAASSRFAETFEAHMNEKGKDFELNKWLAEWTEYDSAAGFGHMQVEPLAGVQHATKVVIRNSFLTHGQRRGGARSLCDFMVGYIEGLLQNFAPYLYEKHGINPRDIRVRHAMKDCCHRHGNPDMGCVFWVDGGSKAKGSG